MLPARGVSCINNPAAYQDIPRSLTGVSRLGQLLPEMWCLRGLSGGHLLERAELSHRGIQPLALNAGNCKGLLALRREPCATVLQVIQLHLALAQRDLYVG